MRCSRAQPARLLAFLNPLRGSFFKLVSLRARTLKLRRRFLPLPVPERRHRSEWEEARAVAVWRAPPGKTISCRPSEGNVLFFSFFDFFFAGSVTSRRTMEASARTMRVAKRRSVDGATPVTPPSVGKGKRKEGLKYEDGNGEVASKGVLDFGNTIDTTEEGGRIESRSSQAPLGAAGHDPTLRTFQTPSSPVKSEASDDETMEETDVAAVANEASSNRADVRSTSPQIGCCYLTRRLSLFPLGGFFLAF